MVYRCGPMSPKWMMIIVTEIFAWILYSSPQCSPISSGYLRFFLFSVIFQFLLIFSDFDEDCKGRVAGFHGFLPLIQFRVVVRLGPIPVVNGQEVGYNSGKDANLSRG